MLLFYSAVQIVFFLMWMSVDSSSPGMNGKFILFFFFYIFL